MAFGLALSTTGSGCKLGCCTMNAITFQVPERRRRFDLTASNTSLALAAVASKPTIHLSLGGCYSAHQVRLE
jgi:hypothetical protein